MGLFFEDVEYLILYRKAGSKNRCNWPWQQFCPDIDKAKNFLDKCPPPEYERIIYALVPIDDEETFSSEIGCWEPPAVAQEVKQKL